MHPSRWLASGMALVCFFACNSRIQPQAVANEPDAAPTSDVVDAAVDAGVPWELDAAGFDRACQHNEECRLVQTGPCASCMCGTTPLSESGSLAYDEQFYAELRRTHCEMGSYLECTDICISTDVATCESGRCERHPARLLDTTKYDHACMTSSDCVVVNTDLCRGRGCTNAIARSALATFEADRAAAPACGTPMPYEPSDCPWLVDCTEGRCTFVPGRTVP